MAQVEMSKFELQEMLEKVVKAASGTPQMNPLEQRRFEEEDRKDKRRDLLAIELAKTEEATALRKRTWCTHSVDRQTGEPVVRGSGRWTTGGQAYQDGSAALMCTRCQNTWRWRPSAEQYSAIVQNGLYGSAPPDDSLLMCNGCLKLKSECSCAADYEKQKLAVA